MSLQRAGQELADLVLRDFVQSPAGGAWCLYLDIQRQNPLTGRLGAQSAYERWCEPPPEPPNNPSQEFQEFGGVACRLYRVTFTSRDSQGNTSTSSTNIRGPIRTSTFEDLDAQGNPRRRILLQGGTGGACPLQQFQMAASSNTNVVQVFATIDNIEPLEGIGQPDIPIPVPPDQLPPPYEIDFNTELNVDLGGFELNVPITIGPLIFNVFGAFVPISVRPNAEFNLPIDINLNAQPRFGLDLDLEFVLPLAPGGRNPTPAPGSEPIPVPGRDRLLNRECTPVDYERIEDIVEDAKCCKPVTDTTSLGTFTFEDPNQVINLSLPGNTVACFLAIIPGANSRAYKLAGPDAEFGHGNASITTSGHALSFERLYVNNHELHVPFELEQKGVRISCKQGTIVNVVAGLFIPTVEG